MAAIAGTLTTRILVATGDSEPTEVGTVTTDLHATGNGAGITLSARRWRRGLALAFLRMAWATWTMGREHGTP
ncbi:hypothetical protein [Microbacterium album]|uniref:Uncharacterized protein n=1 Tax=Microbacterium album TaxID=2053191 RepID=A0A917MMB8_9MICO|nr:hypothetical protein [Microbacterium album]GGH34151.1 hypothetical protein GCM10010921_01640 [Microbacterium album]